jgi:hypothetical protein
VIEGHGVMDESYLTGEPEIADRLPELAGGLSRSLRSFAKKRHGPIRCS